MEGGIDQGRFGKRVQKYLSVGCMCAWYGSGSGSGSGFREFAWYGMVVVVVVVL